MMVRRGFAVQVEQKPSARQLRQYTAAAAASADVSGKHLAR
jgi:hypothetical protein